MIAKDILKQTKHRAFMYPQRPWKFYQEWNKAIFLHWEVAPKLIQSLIPKGLGLDTIHGKTWISLVAFDMNNVGIRHLPKPPYVTDFHEINIRVYTICKGKPNVYFLSMEGSKRSSCKVLKTLFKLPYQYSKMKRHLFSYESKNKVSNNSFYIEFKLENTPISKDETDIWLTERYALVQDYRTNIIEYDVHHLEWPMQAITVEKLELNYPQFNQLIGRKRCWSCWRR
jgi:uncharacterized protein YqjF (DUF2071 family)